MLAPQVIGAIDELQDAFDLFLFDQYGVLHDGCQTCPGMIDCVSRLKTSGKSIAVISNSGKRAAYNAERLSRFGFGPGLIDVVVSSGEVAWYQLREQLLHTHPRGIPGKVLFVGRGRDRSAIADLPLRETGTACDADVILISGSEPERFTLDDYRRLLAEAAERAIPAFCTNPDRWSLAGSVRQFGPGQIALGYEQAGGSVTWIGKPHAAIYQHVLDRFDVPASRVLCIGDSIEHDIRGALNTGCASLLTATGIHAGQSYQELESDYERYHATPRYLMQRQRPE
jgi:HAD superfamily hydrolase (TIGR01459 family)